MINIRMQEEEDRLRPRITVIGVGGAGGNAVNNMIRSNLEGVDFLIANTDAQAIENSVCERKLQLGLNITRGLGAGSKPEVGRAAAEEVLDEIMTYLDGANMVFITAGMGGGTGTGASPVIARAAREQGILTVGVVTKPFHFEGSHRMKLAEQGIEELQQYVDTLLVIPNQNLFRIATEKTTFADAFKMADEVLHSGVRGVTDLMVMPGLINLDFADIRSVMSEMGKAMMGTGEATGERRAIEASEAAISNPLLDDVSMKGARGVLINITGGLDMTLFEVDEAANRIRDEVDPQANIIFGSTFNEELEGTMRVSVVATGIDADMAMFQDKSSSKSTQAKSAPIQPQIKPKHPPKLGQRPAAKAAPTPVQEDVAEFEEDVLEDAFIPEEADLPQNDQPDYATYAENEELEEEYEEEDDEDVLEDEDYEEEEEDDEDMVTDIPEAPSDPRHTQQKVKKASSLFERFTGVVRDQSSQPQQKPAPKQSAKKQPAAEQQKMALDQNKTNTSNDETDDLNIPAFLRRQAN